MRNPVRTEAEAFTFTLVIAVLAVAIGVAAWLGGTWAGLGVFVGLALGVLAAFFLRSEPRVREAAIWDRGLPAEPRHVLVIANETCTARALCDEIRYRVRGADADVLVVAPALSSHVRYWTSDVDGARASAQERLDASLAALAAAGVRARGEIGDADPLQAIEDALRTFGAGEIIISTHPPGRSNWLERDVVAHARERFDIPITHVVVDVEHEAATIQPAEPIEPAV
jgi:GABA permease